MVSYLALNFCGKPDDWIYTVFDSYLYKSRWNKLIQKPFDEGDERGLKLVQSILKPIMLRRTKLSIDRDGRQVIGWRQFIQFCFFL